MGNRKESEFDEIDPYNPENRVAGIIYRTNQEYGSMLIKTVNGKSCEQYIHATPKFYYPGNTLSYRSYEPGLFPEFTSIVVYDKLDGTNIFAYRYKNAEGKPFITFKTRLVPFLKANGFKDWILMWNKMVEKYHDQISAIKDFIFYNEDISGVAFEMYGSANRILVEYKEPLDIAMLYYIDTDGNVHDPAGYNFGDLTGGHDCNKPKEVAFITDGVNPDSVYQSLIETLEKQFVESRSVEGCMFYIHTTTGTIAWKCKPPSVLSAQSEGSTIGYDDAYTTALNAMESVGSIDDLEKETYALLSEVYDDLTIEMCKIRIDKAIKEAKTYVLFRKDVVSTFKRLGLKWNGITEKSSSTEKGAVMRPMMKECQGKNASKVFGALLDYFAIFGE